MSETFLSRYDAEQWLANLYGITEAEAAEIVALHCKQSRVEVNDLEREVYSRGHKRVDVYKRPIGA